MVSKSSGSKKPLPSHGSRKQGGFAKPKERPEGGYKLIPVAQIAAAWFCYLQGHLRIADLRVYFACQEAIARRCALPQGHVPKFTHREILALTGGTERRLKASLKRLQAVGLLTFSESEIRFAKHRAELGIDLGEFQPFLDRFPNHKRLLPVPRRILRFLAAGARPSLIATVLGHLVWGLYATRQGGFKAWGRMKASWVAETFCVDLRRVKEARRELIELGWLVPEKSKQWEQNRWGASFRINLAWKKPRALTTAAASLAGVARPAATGRPSAPVTAQAADSCHPVQVERPAAARPELPPPPPVSGPELPPPDPDQKLPERELKNQKPASGGPFGVQIHHRGGEEKPAPPRLKHIVPEDLKETPRLFELHAQAVASELISSSENDRLRFVAAAEHARTIGQQNPCGLFAWLIRTKHWNYLTQDDEDAANSRLKTFFFGAPLQSVPSSLAPPLRPQPNPLSADARLVQAVRGAAAKAGYRGDAFPLLRKEKPEWTRQRWDQAVRELDGTSSLKGTVNRIGSILSAENIEIRHHD